MSDIMSAPHHDPAMTFENAASMGLSQEEWDLILTRLGRTPNLCEEARASSGHSA